jgi:hypothetical protein
MCWVIKSPKLKTEGMALAKFRELWQMGIEQWWNSNQEGKARKKLNECGKSVWCGGRVSWLLSDLEVKV